MRHDIETRGCSLDGNNGRQWHTVASDQDTDNVTILIAVLHTCDTHLRHWKVFSAR